MRKFYLIASLTLLLTACGDSDSGANKDIEKEGEGEQLSVNNEPLEDEEIITLEPVETTLGYLNEGLSDFYFDTYNSLEMIEKYGKEYYVSIGMNANALDGNRREVLVTVVENGEVINKDVSTILTTPSLDALKAEEMFVKREGNVFGAGESTEPVESFELKYKENHDESNGTNNDSLIMIEQFEIYMNYTNPTTGLHGGASQPLRTTISTFDMNEDGTLTYKNEKTMEKGLTPSIQKTADGQRFFINVGTEYYKGKNHQILNADLSVESEFEQHEDVSEFIYSDLKRGYMLVKLTDNRTAVYDLNARDFIWNEDGSLVTYDDLSPYNSAIYGGENGFYAIEESSTSSTDFTIKYYEFDAFGFLAEVDSFSISSELPRKKGYFWTFQEDTFAIIKPVEFKGKPNFEKYVFSRLDNL